MTSAGTPHPTLKIIMIGDSGVGKSSIMERFVANRFSESSNSTIGLDFKERTIQIDGKMIKLQIWDTAGLERFNAITNSYFKKADGIMLVYDVTKADKFDGTKKWIEKINKKSEKDVAKILVGNKCEYEHLGNVPRHHGEDFADEHGFMFIQTSAKINMGIYRAFFNLAENVLSKQQSSDPTVDGAIRLRNQDVVQRKRC